MEFEDKPIKRSDFDKLYEWLKFVNKEKAKEFYELTYRFEHNGMDCYCCTCTYDHNNNLVSWDPACRNHGAHGQRGCDKHRQSDVDCNCGCGYRIKETTDEKS